MSRYIFQNTITNVMMKNDQIMPITTSKELMLMNSFLQLSLEEQKEQIEHNSSIVNMVDPLSSNTLLHLAVQKEDFSLIEYLIEKGANIDSKNNSGQTPLHLAVTLQNHKIINLLLEEKANPNEIDSNGESPVHIAAYNDDFKVIKLLLLFKADIFIRDKTGKFPIDCARQTGHKKSFDVLYNAALNTGGKNKSSKNVLKYDINNYSFTENGANTPFGNYMNAFSISKNKTAKNHRTYSDAYTHRNFNFGFNNLSDGDNISNNNNSTLSNGAGVNRNNLTEVSGFYSELAHKPRLRLIPEEGFDTSPVNKTTLMPQVKEMSIQTSPNTMVGRYKKPLNTVKGGLYIKKIVGRNYSSDRTVCKAPTATHTSGFSIGTEKESNIKNANTNPFCHNKHLTKFEENNLNADSLLSNNEVHSLMISNSGLVNEFPWTVNENGTIYCKMGDASEVKDDIDNNMAGFEIFKDGELEQIIASKKNDIDMGNENLRQTFCLKKNNTLRTSTKSGNSGEKNSYAYEEINTFIKNTDKGLEEIDDEIIENDDDDMFEVVEPNQSTEEEYINSTNPNLRISITNPKYLKDDLFSFLQEISMEMYTNQFFNEGFDDIKLILNQMKSGFGITDENLKELGITKAGDRARILVRLQELSGGFNFSIPFNAVYYYNKKDFKDVKYDFHIKAMINWLKELKMEEFIEGFYKNGYHSLELIYVQLYSSTPFSEKILEEDIGISKIGYRTRILNKIKEDGKKYVENLRRQKLEFNNRGSINYASCKCLIF